MKTSEVLRTAGDLLRARGWCQREFENDAGALCAYGAIREVVDVSSENGTWTPFVEEFDLVVETPNLHMPAWNDADNRTVDEVLVAMDAAYVLRLQVEGIEPGDVL